MTTFNTGNPIGSTDARDRSDNSEFLDEVVNSLDLTKTDRLGRTRDTLEGIYQKSAYYRVGTFDAGYTLTNSRQTLAYGNVEYSWSGAFPKVVPTSPSTSPDNTGGIGSGAWVDRTQDTVRSALTGGGSLGAAFNVINVDLPPYSGNLAELIREVNNNTTILLGNRSYDCSSLPQFNAPKNNITIIGAGMPSYSEDGTQLVGGSIIQGNNKFGVCSGFSMFNLGLDAGSQVVDSLYAGTSIDGLSAIGDDQYFDNVRILIKSNAAQPKHGIIFELHDRITHGYLETKGGYHGYVVKSSNVIGGDVVVNETSGTTFIIKADNGNSYSNIHVNSITHRGLTGLTPSGIFEAITNGTLSDIFIGKYVGRKVNSGVMFTKDSTGTISDIDIDVFDIDAASSNGFALDNGTIGRITIGTHKIKNCTGQGFYLDGGYSLNIGSGYVVNSGQNGYYFGGNLSRENIQVGDIRADGCISWGVKNDALIPFNPHQIKGSGNTSGLISANFGVTVVALGTGWTNDFFASKVVKMGRLVTISGIVLSAKTSNIIMTLPTHLRPSVTEVFSCEVTAPAASGASTVVRVFVQSDTGQVKIDPSALSAVGSVVLSGISFYAAV